nr:baseplate J/gp47 family protein [Pyxidicoccus fallax]
MDVTIDDRPWYAQEHLHGSRSYDRHYVATTSEDGSVWLHFGDGVRGHEVRVDPVNNTPRIVLRYRIGEPIAGNCAPGTLTRVVPPEDPTSDEGIDFGSLGSVRATNVVPGSGGREPESLDAARQAIPASLRRGEPQRAVTLRDYAAVAEQVRGVARATVRVIGGSFNTLLLLIDPEGQEELDPALEQAVFERLDGLRMVGRELRVAAPIYVPLDIELAICAEPGWPRHEVRERVYAALRPGTRERPGYFHPDHLSFAEAVELGEVLAHVQSLPGVRSVKAFTFRPLRSAHAPKVAARIRLDTTEVARLDADPSYPENGRLVVRVEGLDSLLESPAYKYAIDVPPSEGA